LDINWRLAGRAFHLPGQAHAVAWKASAQNELQIRKPAVHKGVLFRAGRTERFNILPLHPQFIPASTSLSRDLLNFKNRNLVHNYRHIFFNRLICYDMIL